MGGGDAGDLGVVVGGRDLHDVGADQVEGAERAQRGQQFPAGQAARLRGAGAGRVCRVEHVDVDRDVHRAVADPGGDPLHQARHTEVLDLGGGHHLEAELGVLGQVGPGIQRAADAGVQAARSVQ